MPSTGYQLQAGSLNADDRHAMQRYLAYLYLAAGALGALTPLVPHYPGTNVAAVLSLCAASLVAGGLVATMGSRLPVWCFKALLACGTLLTGAAIYFTQGVPNAASLFFLWIALYAFYFFSRTHALMQMTLVGAVYALDIALLPPPFPAAAHWITTVGALTAAGVFVGALKRRLDVSLSALEDVARTDHLTGLLNRRGFEERLEAEIERVRRSGRQLSLVIADLDGFKRVNDTLGHPAGDGVLVRFADVLRDEIRRVDAASRLGGEEFALVLPETSGERACRVAQRLREAVVSSFAGDQVPLTVSLGVAAVEGAAGTSDTLLESADRALYEAKRRGRNRVVAVGDEACPAATEPEFPAARSSA